MRHRRLRRSHEPPEIDVTAFMNLMVVLIPFLLLSAAFNHLTMFELYLPAASAEAQAEPDKRLPALTLELRATGISLQVDGRRDALIPDLDGGEPDTQELQARLRPLKNRYPALTQISILSEAQIPYARIIEVMDAVRAMQIEESGPGYRLELFPDIALGATDSQPS
ncbi:biopolymer transporter ExbD [Motiliproteus sp. SC1-56]|uniref:ExbD/TolR family protein n=1 Tax=Motiliproteus sp. SC1-56 TaxID=2799565 RepID=UPI001A8E8D02|nr:biopolymer transporter ExbD [Motiliproteus sp. SC1-56]